MVDANTQASIDRAIKWNNEFYNGGPKKSTGLVSGAMTAPAAQTYRPTTSQVDKPTETVQGQVDSILAKDSPLMQRARTLATQGMARRGLVNSSMAQGAGVAAMTDQAVDIGTKDATIYGNRAVFNADAQNTAGQFNAGQANGMAQFNAGQANSLTQLDRELASRDALQQGQQKFQGTQADLDRAQQVQLNDAGIKAQQTLQQGQQQFQATQSDLDRAQQTQLTETNLKAQQSLQTNQQQFSALQSQLDRDNQRSLLQFQDTLNNTAVSKTFAANTATGTLNAINAIQADPNLTPEAKKAAIQNVIDVGNTTMQWASTFYQTPLPTIAAPGSTASTLQPGKA